MSRGPHRALEVAVNRALALDPEREEVLAPLVGHRVGVRVEGASFLDMCVSFERGRVQVDDDVATADVLVAGPPQALVAMMSRTEELPAGTGITVRGDVGLLQQARRAVARLRPDWEEPVARLLGDELGQQVTRALGHMAAVVRRTARELGADAGEYLREESGVLATAAEVADFAAEVDEARDHVERLDRRIARLARDRGQGS